MRHLALLLSAALPVLAQAPRLEELAFLAGSWRGAHGRGVIEEHWVAAPGLPMMGMFRRAADGKVAFAELMTLAQEADGVRFRIRHFSGDLAQAWEPQDAPTTFRLVSVKDGAARFEGEGAEAGARLLYQRTPEGLRVVLEKAKDGKPQRLEMAFLPAPFKP